MPLYDSVVQFETAAVGTVDVSVHINHNEAWHVLERHGWQRTGTERNNWVEWTRPLDDTAATGSTIDAFQRLYANVAYPAALAADGGALAREAIDLARRGQTPAASSTARPSSTTSTPRTSHTAPSIERTER